VVSSTIRSSGWSGVRSSKNRREVAFRLLGRPNLPRHAHAVAEAEPPDLARRDVDVVRAGEVVGVGAAQEAEAIGQDFQRALAEHQAVEFHALAEDAKHQILLLRARHVADLLPAGEVHQFLHRELLQFGHLRVALLEGLVAVGDVGAVLDLGGDLLRQGHRLAVVVVRRGIGIWHTAPTGRGGPDLNVEGEKRGGEAGRPGRGKAAHRQTAGTPEGWRRPVSKPPASQRDGSKLQIRSTSRRVYAGSPEASTVDVFPGGSG
jgi:hypothetical protein